jgi:hypothetical protein
MLAVFVPPPEPFTIPTLDELPATVREPGETDELSPESEEIPLRVRETARDALADLKAVLRLIDLGEFQVSEKLRRPTAAGVKKIRGVLHGGDFYGDADQSEWKEDPASDLTMKAFAWPLLLQGAALAEPAGPRLRLTAAGRKAIPRAAHEVIRTAWDKWQSSSLLDEYNRVAGVKGQKGNLTALVRRRKAFAEVLRQCPGRRWVAIDELFRAAKVLGRSLQVSRNQWQLYIAEHYYGNLGKWGSHEWELLEGRYFLALLFEYAATLGLVDVAYINPQGARSDHSDRWGTDDLSCLSRYDGLHFIRINALGMWCLGLAPDYEPEAVAAEALLQVLPNLDVVASDRPVTAADLLLLDRFAERRSESVWRLEAARVLAAVEEGLTVGELREFLQAKSPGPLPQTVTVFLDDLKRKARQVRDLGSARLAECADATVAQLLANDARLRKLCELAGERRLVFQVADEAAVRRRLRELGYVLPPG